MFRTETAYKMQSYITVKGYTLGSDAVVPVISVSVPFTTLKTRLVAEIYYRKVCVESKQSVTAPHMCIAGGSTGPN